MKQAIVLRRGLTVSFYNGGFNPSLHIQMVDDFDNTGRYIPPCSITMRGDEIEKLLNFLSELNLKTNNELPF